MSAEDTVAPTRRLLTRQLSDNGRNLLLAVADTDPKSTVKLFSPLVKQTSYWFGPGTSSDPAIQV